VQESALRIAGHHGLITVILHNDRALLLQIAYELQELEGLDFLVITDSEGIVLLRTLEPEMYGDYLGHLSHVQQALSGNVESYVMDHGLWGPSVYAVAPIYDERNIAGIVLAGLRLDSEYAEGYSVSPEPPRGGDASSTPPPQPPSPSEVQAVSIVYSGRVMTDITMRVGEIIPLSVRIEPLGIDAEVVWSSSDRSVFEVTPTDVEGTSARVTGVGRGTATLTVTFDGVVAECAIRVRQ
jgi:hypothetical protein